MEPELLLFDEFNGDWDRYEQALHDIFMRDIARAKLTFRGWDVSCKRIPKERSRWFTFWHLVQEGRFEDEREPDLRRCERIRWPAFVIGSCDANADIQCWNNRRGSERNTLLWYKEQYLVVLAKRNGYWLLKTAYCTDQRRTVDKLKAERDAARRS